MSKEPVLIAIGGASGAGKTAVVRELQKRFPDDVKFFPAFTTRPRRSGELEGRDYFFRTEKDMETARKDPECFGFVRARDYWYWMRRPEIERSFQTDRFSLYLFVLTQRYEVQEYRSIFPGIRYIWLSVPEEEIRKRLQEARKDVEASFNHNRKLQETRVDDLADLRIDNSQGNFEQTIRLIVSFWKQLSSS